MAERRFCAPACERESADARSFKPRATAGVRASSLSGLWKTMLLVGRESHPLKMDADLLTFECECGQTSVATTNN